MHPQSLKNGNVIVIYLKSKYFFFIVAKYLLVYKSFDFLLLKDLHYIIGITEKFHICNKMLYEMILS